MTSSPIASWQIDGETMDTVRGFIFLGSKITADGDCGHEIKRCLLLERKAMTNLDSILKRRDITDKSPSSQSYGFSSSHVWMQELDYKESWVPENWCFWTVVLEKTLESPFDYKEIKQVHPKGNQSWIFIGNDPDAGKDRRREEKGMTEDEMVGITDPRDMSLSKLQELVMDREAWRGAVPWGRKELDMTEQLNWTDANNSINILSRKGVWIGTRASFGRMQDPAVPW